MISKSMAGRLLAMALILGASVVAGAQTQSGERASFPQAGTGKYWLVVDEFADRVVHFAYAKRFVQLHARFLTDHQCEQYSRIAVEYEDELASVRRSGVSGENGFWNDVRAYSIRMIGPPGVPIPVHPSSNYWVTTGSDANDRDLRRVVSLEIDVASSHSVPASEYALSDLNSECRNAGQEPTAKVQP